MEVDRKFGLLLKVLLTMICGVVYVIGLVALDVVEGTMMGGNA